MKINTLTSAEEHLMQVIWKLNSPFMRDIMEALPEPKPHQNTVSTYLKILVEKEFLSTEKVGRIFKYNVVIPYEDYRKFVLELFLENYFNGSGSDLVKNLFAENLIKPSDLNEFFEVRTEVVPIIEPEKEHETSKILEYIDELTEPKKKKKEKSKSKKKKKK